MATSTRSPAKKAAKTRYVLLGTGDRQFAHFKRLASPVCKTRSDIQRILNHVSRHTLWIAGTAQAADMLIDAVAPTHQHSFGNFLALCTPHSSAIAALQAFFDAVVGVGADFKFLPDEELVEALMTPTEEARDLFIGGRADLERQTVMLIRGNLQQIVVPLNSFQPNQACAPDPRRFRLTDYGNTVCLGDYEASNHSILYEIDPDYRRRYRAKRRAQDKSFGASLGRLRRLKGISRGDFAPLSAKEVARIERGEIEKPRPRTLKTIAARLKVEPDEIEDY